MTGIPVRAGAAALLLLATAATQSWAQGRGPLIPFESERAASRGDQQQLRLLDDASRIPAHRIHGLPIVDGKIGEYAQLDSGLQVYFPYGRIERAESKFAKYQVDLNGGRADPHPEYRRVAGFDKALGPICASREFAGGERMEMRILDRAITVVHRTPDRSQPNLPTDAETIRVVTSTNLHWLQGEPEAAALHRSCQQGRSTAARPAAASNGKQPAKKTN
ncbi:hypothetical protein [Desertibaculum subflavum]|uniref:hypothetical protein n=1 Tax=Desertibaculum subflavum TaxID=2268458 RepID=UPI0013C4785B